MATQVAATAAQLKYYCIDHPARQFQEWCLAHNNEIAQLLHPHHKHWFQLPHLFRRSVESAAQDAHTLEKVRHIMDFFSHGWIFWTVVIVGAYIVGRVGIGAVWSDLTTIFSKIKGAATASTTPASGTTPAATAPAATTASAA